VTSDRAGLLGDEVMAALELAGLGEYARRLEPGTWLPRALARLAARAEYMELPEGETLRSADPWAPLG
jgi:hypothetical protein